MPRRRPLIEERSFHFHPPEGQARHTLGTSQRILVIGGRDRKKARRIGPDRFSPAVKKTSSSRVVGSGLTSKLPSFRSSLGGVSA